MKTIKTNSSTNIIKLNNQTYIPFQLHQLPKYYNEIPLSEQFNLKGYCYINLDDHSDTFNLQNFKNRLTFNKDIHYSLKR